GVCSNGTCQNASCGDQAKNGNETDVDCGGSCSKCPAGEHCGSVADCTTGICISTTCQNPSCTDGIKNGSEIAIDCGGANCSKCPAGSACNANADCTTNSCYQSSCCTPKSCGTQSFAYGSATDTCGSPLSCGN